MFWSYDTRTYSDFRPWIVLSVLRYVKHFKAVYSLQTQITANLRRKHWLNYRHRCNNRCKIRFMHEGDALALNFNHTTVYAHIVITSHGPTIRICVKSDNTAMTTDLMVI